MRVAVRLFSIAFACLWPAVGQTAPDRASQNQGAKVRPAVIIISVDGLASFYLDDPKARMPTIRALAEAGVEYVQLDEPRHDQPAALRVPGLDPARRYQVSDVTPGPFRLRRSGLDEPGIPAVQASGAALGEIGLAIAPRRALTAAVILIEAC